MITAQQARDNYDNHFSNNYATSKLFLATMEEIKSKSKGGLRSCKPFAVDYEMISLFGTIKQLSAFRESMIEVIKQLKELGYSVHVPKKLFSRKPKYEETIIRW